MTSPRDQDETVAGALCRPLVEQAVLSGSCSSFVQLLGSILSLLGPIGGGGLSVPVVAVSGFVRALIATEDLI